MPGDLQPSASARFWFRALGALVVLLAPLILLAIAHRLWIRRRALVGLRSQGPSSSTACRSAKSP